MMIETANSERNCNVVCKHSVLAHYAGFAVVILGYKNETDEMIVRFAGQANWFPVKRSDLTEF